MRREPDYFRSGKASTAAPLDSHSVSTPVSSDRALLALFKKHLDAAIPPVGFAVHTGMNATTDYFYDSQGVSGCVDVLMCVP